MTIQTIIGIDVAKDELVSYRQDTDTEEVLENNQASIKRWLRCLPAHCAIAIEATGTYHVLLIKLAYQYGHTVYVIDGYQLKHYRQGIGGRAKTDSSDARLLARYLSREQEALRPGPRHRPPTGRCRFCCAAALPSSGPGWRFSRAAPNYRN